MKNHLIIASVLATLSTGALAADVVQRQMPNGAPQGGRGDMMQNLTDEQRACIEQFGCEMPGKPDAQGARPEGMPDGGRPEPGTRPENGERPEMTDEQKSNMECMQKAMESCGIEMPARPERKPE